MHDDHPHATPARATSPATWAVLAHLGGIVAYFFLGWVAPLVVWLLHRRTDHVVAQEARSALNFQLTVLVALVAARIVEEFPFVGVVGAIARVGLGITALVLAVLAAVAASTGARHRYPFALELVR
ncbi:DUF4870 domain-containing protein [Cellulomonas sp. JZ18]|uniref:DUF4870 domain-containing protein n=1 Tax=Cellulomonas sp. JZ18 TaxID=2654191 RepID=UPI0012D3F442|nr:DUF4870 domain-containing protein [Cellulomonas sp. JZ18]QGQ19013.1 DUF4870 domain-containing protein [Cellulomonas sp. JZ18]